MSTCSSVKPTQSGLLYQMFMFGWLPWAKCKQIHIYKSICKCICKCISKCICRCICKCNCKYIWDVSVNIFVSRPWMREWGIKIQSIWHWRIQHSTKNIGESCQSSSVSIFQIAKQQSFLWETPIQSVYKYKYNHKNKYKCR